MSLNISVKFMCNGREFDSIKDSMFEFMVQTFKDKINHLEPEINLHGSLTFILPNELGGKILLEHENLPDELIERIILALDQ